METVLGKAGCLTEQAGAESLLPWATTAVFLLSGARQGGAGSLTAEAGASK